MFLVTIVFDEVKTEISCIHTKLIIVCPKLREVTKDRLLPIYVCRLCYGSKNNKDVLFHSIRISFDKSVSTCQFPVNEINDRNNYKKKTTDVIKQLKAEILRYCSCTGKRLRLASEAYTSHTSDSASQFQACPFSLRICQFPFEEAVNLSRWTLID